MDAGCYPIHALRFLAGAEPEVVGARALLRSPEVDRRMEAELRFPDGRSAHMLCSLWSSTLLRVSLRVRGDEGELSAFNWVAPQIYHRLTVRTLRGRRVEKLRGDATYTHQLRAFRDAVGLGRRVPTDPADAIANMRVIDEIYRKAGLRPRGTSSGQLPARGTSGSGIG
jgi:predicted dehydrogenase